MDSGKLDKNYQGIGVRAVAQVIDFFVSILVFLIVGSLLAGSIGFHLTGTPALIAIGVSSFIIFLYFFVLEATKGQTLGKIVTGIKVVKEDGNPCDAPSSFLRNILRIIDGIFVYLLGAILIAQSDKNQRIGDRAANTVVIDT